MKYHDLKLLKCYEWSDDYSCTHCGKLFNIGAEDTILDEDFLESLGECSPIPKESEE